MELCISSRGMSALVAGTAAGSGKQTQSTAAGGNGVQAATQQRKPRKISLKALDLTRAPTEEELKTAALSNPRIQERIAGKTVRNVIVVPKKLVNIVE